MTSADAIPMAHCLSHGQVHSQVSGNTLFLKNDGILTSSARIETSVKRMLWEQLATEQETSANLVDQVDELKRKTEKTEREFEEFKIQQQEEYNKLRENIMRISSSCGNSQ
jgi:bacterioferritin (cytochrome b1)